jgi:hypothetical protein
VRGGRGRHMLRVVRLESEALATVAKDDLGPFQKEDRSTVI